MSCQPISVNGIDYRIPPKPVVVVCIDGGDPRYLDACRENGLIPNLERFMKDGVAACAESAMPSYTNPNNISLITGRPPSVHGINGNFFLDPKTGREIMMNDPEFIRCPTILAAFSKQVPVAAITAKDKLRRLLGKDVSLENGSVSFSSEKADQCTMSDNGLTGVLDMVGMPLPEVYSAELSLFVLEAGIKLLQSRRPRVMYLSLTDYIQHKHAPGTPVANRFFADLDDAFGRLAALDAVIALTADHGMNDKSKDDGSPNIVYVQTELDLRFGTERTKVLLTATDPYVVHHGCLGGFAGVYCFGPAVPDVVDYLASLDGIEAVYDRLSACRMFDLPADRQPDIAVIGDAGTVVGASEAYHDLSALRGERLRSHGGIAERRVPFILSHPLNRQYADRLANTKTLKSYEIFDYAINGAEPRGNA